MTTPQRSSILGRYRLHRRRQLDRAEHAYANGLPGWRTQRRRRILIRLLVATFGFMALVSVLCAIGVGWAPLLWLPACLALFPLARVLHLVSGRRGEAPESHLDEFEVAQRNRARSVGLSVTQLLVLIPALYLVFGATITGGTDTDMAYAGGLMVLTAMLAGGMTPAIILGWTRPDPDAS